MRAKRACEICGGKLASGAYMCAQCQKAYDRYAWNVDGVMGAIVWAARRARRYTLKQQRERIRGQWDRP